MDSPSRAAIDDPRRRLALVAAVYLGSFIATLDVSIVNVALPTLQRALATDLAGLQWVIDIYALCLSAFMLSAGPLGDRYGRKRAWLAGVVVFTIGSAMCAMAGTLSTLLAGRAVQGVAGALLIPGALSILACLLAIGLIDKIGRKPLLLIGSAGMAVTLAIVAYAFSTAVTGADGGVVLPGHNGLMALIAANLYVIFFNLSWGPIMWVMLGEMFPNQIRGSGLAVAGFAQWIANAAISVSFPSLAVSPGLVVTYTGYALFAAISFFFVRAMVHETKGRELEDMVG